MSAKIIDGTSMAQEIRAEVAQTSEQMKTKHGVTPGLAVVLVGDDPASAVYVRNKGKAATEAGIFSENINLPAETKQDELLELLGRLNNDTRFHGIPHNLPCLTSQTSKVDVRAWLSPLPEALQES